MRQLPIFLSLMIFAFMIAQPEKARAYMLPDGCNGSSVSWSNLVPTFRANTFAGASPSGDFAETISLFSRNPTNLSFWQFIDFGMYNVGFNNGHTEVWPLLELTEADIFNGDLFASVGSYNLDGCDIVEGDVVFNLAYQWANTNQKSDYDSYGDGSPDLSGKVAGLHELGHLAGFAHDCCIYNVMGLSWRHLWANDPDASVYLGEPLVAGIVDTYGNVGPPTLQQREVSVSHWQYDSCATGGYSEHRRTSMFDQSGDELAMVPGEVEPRFIAAAGQTIDVDFTFENQGTTIQEGVEVGLGDLQKIGHDEGCCTHNRRHKYATCGGTCLNTCSKWSGKLNSPHCRNGHHTGGHNICHNGATHRAHKTTRNDGNFCRSTPDVAKQGECEINEEFSCTGMLKCSTKYQKPNYEIGKCPHRNTDYAFVAHGMVTGNNFNRKRETSDWTRH